MRKCLCACACVCVCVRACVCVCAIVCACLSVYWRVCHVRLSQKEQCHSCASRTEQPWDNENDVHGLMVRPLAAEGARWSALAGQLACH